MAPPFIRVGRSKPGFASERSVWRCLFMIGQGSGQHFALLIPPEKAEQAGDALIAHGFPEETMQQDYGFSAYVRDPDGNKIELYARRTDNSVCSHGKS